MKALTKAKHIIVKSLTSKECWELRKFCDEQAMLKVHQEQIDRVKAVGIGGKILVRGGNSEAVRYGMACLIGEILKFNPKTVTVKFSDTRSWRVPYSWLTTTDKLPEEQKAKEHMRVFQPYIQELNKIAGEILNE